MAKIYAGTSPELSPREQRNMERVRTAAAEGMVLLENDGTLPLAKNIRTIALFGNGARHTVKGGAGSGDVNSRLNVSVYDGLREAGFAITTDAILDCYDERVRAAEAAYREKLRQTAEQKGAEYVWVTFWSEPYVQPGIAAITQDEIEASRADAAVYVIARKSGEGYDRKAEAGDYELTDEEKRSIAALAQAYGHLIVVLNVGGVIDTKFLRAQKGIGAVLLMSQAGNVGGRVLADVLTGKSVPSGHLTTTWAENYTDYPNADTFSHRNGNLDDEYYTEGIYVGYRYFDSFGITPAYPFGYGKSYTQFSVGTEGISLDGTQISLRVRVANTGVVYSGKEVVQVYASAPRGRLEKPFQVLVAYAKTKLLQPGESEELTICFPAERMASYDEEKAAWLLEAGEYRLRVGTHSRATHVAAAIDILREIVTEQLSNHMPLDCEMELFSAKNAVPYRAPWEDEEAAAAIHLTVNPELFPTEIVQAASAPKPLPQAAGQKLTLPQVMRGEASLAALTAQLTVREMATLCVGTARSAAEASTIGSASAAVPGAAGETSPLMQPDRDIRNLVLADGPAGLRLHKHFEVDQDGNILPAVEEPFPGTEGLFPQPPRPKAVSQCVTHCQYCTAIPIATLLAQSWNPALIEAMGDLVGEEMELFGVDLWLAPGMNIHRNPLCGRNFEYYSEDPLVAGLCAAADTRGVQAHRGRGTTIKHFACNNQEDNRMHVNAHVGERALREIYLRGFEIAIKEAQPQAMMSSYNLLNGTHTANRRDLLTEVARGEWGFDGIIMTDWGTTDPGSPLYDLHYQYPCSDAAECIAAGNDLIQPGCQADVDAIVAAVQNGTLSLAALQACAMRVLGAVTNAAAYRE